MVKGRKITGGKYKTLRKKKKFSLSGVTRKVKLSEKPKQKIKKGLGGNNKKVLLSTNFANITNPETKKTQKSKIKNVLETPSNRFLARQNILVKSAIIETELGKAKITNRPSQEGSVQAVLIQE
jgi:small subunit ribosomal protein S8e|tara:strand:+ start:473 stop:844 length:372 start_codon:yes stop_codon:yes gene_type:complete